MSTRMDGIVQPSLFSGAIRIDVVVGTRDRYRVLAENLPWLKLDGVANKHRSMRVDIDNGRPLNLRMHLGALFAQSMNRWTDRETEDMVRLHAGVRLLCGVEGLRTTTGSPGSRSGCFGTCTGPLTAQGLHVSRQNDTLLVAFRISLRRRLPDSRRFPVQK